MGKFQDLKVWQRAKDAAVYTYKITAKGQFEKDFSLRDQMRRTAVSTPSNNSEGDEYGSDKQAIRFFNVAKGSAAELLMPSIIAFDIGCLSDSEFQCISEECKGISAMLTKLIRVRSQP